MPDEKNKPIIKALSKKPKRTERQILDAKLKLADEEKRLFGKSSGGDRLLLNFTNLFKRYDKLNSIGKKKKMEQTDLDTRAKDALFAAEKSGILKDQVGVNNLKIGELLSIAKFAIKRNIEKKQKSKVEQKEKMVGKTIELPTKNRIKFLPD